MISQKINSKLESLKSKVKSEKARLTEEFQEKKSELSVEIKDKYSEFNELSEEISQKKQQLKEELKSKQLKMLAQFKRRQKALSSEWDDVQERSREKWDELMDKYEIDELERMIDRFKVESESLERLPENAVIRELPSRVHFNMTLDNVLMKRRTVRDFSGETIPEAEVAAILWACDGINRKSLKRTTPSALNWQDVSVYVVQANGIWKYLPKRNVLLFIEGNDQREHFGEIKPWMKLASQHLVFVSDKRKMETFTTKIISKTFDFDTSDEQMSTIARAVDVGAKVQAVYMACAALGRGCTCRLLANQEDARALLKLDPEEEILAICSIGDISESLFDHTF